jgi:hypothetical protein
MARLAAYPYIGPPPKCDDCRKPLPSSSGHIITETSRLCPDCAYLRDHPDAERVTRLRRPKEPQTEQLPFNLLPPDARESV